MNKGDGTFEEVGYPSGIALNENGREQAEWRCRSMIMTTTEG
ncbi:MAG: hypothetical protein WKF73_16590 [Nocardioidaceae bacterium]